MGCEPVVNAGDVERMLTWQGLDTLVRSESL